MKIVCTNCKSEYKFKELEECPKCKTKTLKYKNNRFAIAAFILSLIAPLMFLINPSSNSPLYSLFFVIFLLGILAMPVAILLGLISIVTNRLYINKFIVLGVLSVIISASCLVYTIVSVSNSVSSDICGSRGTWDCSLNTTIPINGAEFQHNYPGE